LVEDGRKRKPREGRRRSASIVAVARGRSRNHELASFSRLSLKGKNCSSSSRVCVVKKKKGMNKLKQKQ